MRGDWSKELNLRFSRSQDTQVLKGLRRQFFGRLHLVKLHSPRSQYQFFQQTWLQKWQLNECEGTNNAKAAGWAGSWQTIYIFLSRSTFKIMFKFNLINIEWIGGCVLVAAGVRGLAGDISQVFVFRSTFKASPHQPPSDATPKIHCWTFWCKSLCWNAGTQFVCDRTTELPNFWMC